MATLTIHPLSRSGIDVVPFAPSGGGDQFANTGQEFLYLKNDSGGDWTVTITTYGSIDGLAIPYRTVTLPANGTRLVGPFPPAVYNDADGRVSLAYDATANCLVQVFRLIRGE